jgi:hypothetical protein
MSELSPLQQVKRDFGVYSGSEIGQAISRIPGSSHLIEGLIPPGSVNILVGDSGLGKTALVGQLALSVAAGQQFLGFRTSPAKVLLVDYENDLTDSHTILEQLRSHLGLAEYPHNFLFWPVHLGPPEASPVLRMPSVVARLNRFGCNPTVQELIHRLAPELVILDSLRSFNPEMERENAAAARQIRTLRQLAAEYRTAFLMIHHVRRVRVRKTPKLEETPAMEWLLQAAGASALINQTDVRLAIAPASREGVTLILRGRYRMRGEVGPYLIRRLWDESGVASGYERITHSSYLEDPRQEAAYQALPEQFWFREARRIYGRHDEATNQLLHNLMRLGLVRKVGRGQYQKCPMAGEGPKTV